MNSKRVKWATKFGFGSLKDPTLNRGQAVDKYVQHIYPSRALAACPTTLGRFPQKRARTHIIKQPHTDRKGKLKKKHDEVTT